MKFNFKYFLSMPSFSVIVLICLTIIEVHFNLIRWQNKSVIKWDVASYYSYLPAIFIDDDIQFKHIKHQDVGQFANDKYTFITNNKGQHVIKTSCGMALLYSPFFFIAHVLAKPLGYEADGFSLIYQAFIEFSGLFYLLFGLLFLRKSLLYFYNEKATALTLMVVFFGTNLFCYSTIDPAMSHEYTFALFSIFMYFSIKYYEKLHVKYIIYLAVLLALITLIRPINVLFILFPILFYTTQTNFWKVCKTKFIHLIYFILLFGSVISIQLVYWKIVTGQFFYFSYSQEGFFFSNPHLLDCLIGFRKGWLIYSPLIIISFVGLLFLKKQKINLFLIAMLLVPIYYYLISSWWCWWYGGSFGLRAMIDIYPLLCFGFAGFFMQLFTKSKRMQIAVFIFLGLFICVNLIQTYQYKRFVIHYDSMTFKAYLNGINKLESADCDSTLLIHPNYNNALLGKE